MNRQQWPFTIPLFIAGLVFSTAGFGQGDDGQQMPAGMPNMAEMMKQMPPEQAELLRKMMSGQYDNDPDGMMQEMSAADATAQRRRDQQYAEEKARRDAERNAAAARPPAPANGWVNDFVDRYIVALKASRSLAETQHFRAPQGQSHRDTESVLSNAPAVARQQLDIIHRALSRCSNVQTRLNGDDPTARENGEHAYQVLNNGVEGNYCFTMTLAPNRADSGEPWLIGFEQWGG